MLQYDPYALTGLFHSENPTLLTNFNNYVATQDPAATRNYAYNVSDLNLSYRPTIISYAWNLIYAQLEEKRSLKIRGRSINYMASQGSSPDILKNTLNWNRYAGEAILPFSMQVLYVKRGMAIFDDTNAHLAGATRMLRLETILTKDRYHKCRIYKDDCGTVHYITNRWEAADMFKLVGMLPLFYDNLLTKHTDNTTPAYDICNILFNSNMPALEAHITEAVAGLAEAAEARILDNFQQNMTRVSSNSTTQLKKDLNSRMTQIESAYLNIFQQEQAADNIRRQIFAAELCPTAIDPAVIEFLKRTKAIKLISCDDSMAVWDVFTPITNYNKADVEMFFKRTERNVFNNPDWLGKLIIATFIDEKYQLMTHTRIGMHWTDYTVWRKYSDDENRYGNPHITNYNCFSSTKQAVHKAMQNGQMLAAINMIIAAAATITFTDGAVTNSMSTALKGYAKPLKIFKDVETGELISAMDFIDLLTAAEQAKATPTPTADPEISESPFEF